METFPSWFPAGLCCCLSWPWWKRREHGSAHLRAWKSAMSGLGADSQTILTIFKGNFFSTQRVQKQNPPLIVEMSLMSGETHIRSLDCKGTHHLPRGMEKSRSFKSRFSFMTLLRLPVKLIMAGNGSCGSCNPYYYDYYYIFFNHFGWTRFGMHLL